MAKPDIFLGESETTVVERLEIGVDREKSPDIQLKPEVANIHLGGGGGNNSEGDVTLFDNNDNSRVQITAGGGKRADPDTTRVFVDGKMATLTLGSHRREGSLQKGTIRLRSESGLTGRGAEMDGNGNLSLGGGGGGGVIELLRPKRNEYGDLDGFPSITLDADDATATVGGANADGVVNLQNSDGAVTAEVRGDVGQIVTGGQGTAGSILLKNDQAKPVGFLRASGDDVVFTAVDGGGNENVAIRISPDGTVDFPQGGP
jgi:hypothetical protein